MVVHLLRRRILVVLAMFLLFAAPAVHAHVKWFSEFSFEDRPLTLGEAITPTFIGLTILSMVVIGALVVVERYLRGIEPYQQLNNWLQARQDNAEVVMRIALGATLLLSWQADAMLVPDLQITAAWVGWFQFLLALLLLSRRTTPLAGAGVIFLFILTIFEYGIFYTLDYALFIGVGVYLIVNRLKDPRIRGLGLPALYFTTGFSLFWVGLEKVIYPQWGLYVLEQNPQLALGFDVNFFLLAAAFIELSLGYLLIIGLLERPISAAITLVFFMTTLVFGKTEVIGHTIIHGALIVFLLEGAGRVYVPPVMFHRRIPLRIAFAAVNFLLLLAILIVPYTLQAQSIYEVAQAQEGEANPEGDEPLEEQHDEEMDMTEEAP
jgi:uncharacterized membrane protein YphA (DoxX/SURF4 family)